MPFKAYNQEHAKSYNCIYKLPEDPQEYNWICPNCFEFLSLIKYKIESKVKYYFLHEEDIKNFVNNLKNNPYMIWKSNKQIIANHFTEELLI